MSIKEDILRLREMGLSYRKIEKRLGCSKGTISYHCGEGQKDKTMAATRKRRLCPLRTKMEAFIHSRKKETQNTFLEVFAPTNHCLNVKIHQFAKIGSRSTKHEGYSFMFNLKDLKEKIGDDPRCYWTGRKIDLTSRRSYHLDHLVPRSRGGDNSLDNCVLACREANLGKSEFLGEEYVQTSCEVAVHRGKEILARMLARDREFRDLLIAELRRN